MGFEKRIDVDEYAAYEATHPAYGEQLYLAGMVAVRHFGGSPSSILEVGSGPGVTTTYIRELFPSTHVTALDPSPVAFAYLHERVAGDSWVTPINATIQGLKAGDHDLVVSAGASHHTDTREFLNGCRRQMADGAVLVIADEFIGPYSREDERTRNLVEHHWTYVREAVRNIAGRTIPEPEQRRLKAIRRVDSCWPMEVDDLRQLLDEVGRNREGHRDDISAWPRVRLAVLELEALVAGIDYETERKTYASNFLALARSAGLELLEHHRVYGTVGPGEWDAGTHVFAFR